MSQEEIASAADLDRTYISQLERGHKSPTLNTLDKLAACLDVSVQRLLKRPVLDSPMTPTDYFVRDKKQIVIKRKDEGMVISNSTLMSAVNLAHTLIDDMYSADLDIASILGLRNLSAFVGELFVAAIVKKSDGQFMPNPHQDGYPDLLLMDATGRRHWKNLKDRLDEKMPFSPFAGGGIEVKATCGSVPTPDTCRRRGIKRPEIGDTRISCMVSYDWKAHHRETNNLVGLLWDFIGGRPRIASVFYASNLEESDWGDIVQPRAGGGRTTSVSIMNKLGIRKMYDGWQCTFRKGGYREFLNARNESDLIR